MGKIGPFHLLTTSSPPLDEIFQGVPERLAVSAPFDLWNISEGGGKKTWATSEGGRGCVGTFDLFFLVQN